RQLVPAPGGEAPSLRPSPRRSSRSPPARRSRRRLLDADGVIQRAPDDIHSRLTAALGGAPGDVARCMTEIFVAEAPALVGGCDFADELAPVLARWNSANDAASFLATWLSIEVDRSVLGLVAELRRAGVRCALASTRRRGGRGTCPKRSATARRSTPSSIPAHWTARSRRRRSSRRCCG